MEYFLGISLAFGVSLFGTLVGFDRDRAYYPVIMVVIASTYQLFAVIGGAWHALSLESVGFVSFVLVSVIGFRTNLWLVVAALAGHGVFDLVHPHVIANPGVPAWWPMWCLSYDVSAALYLAWLLNRSGLPARPRDGQISETRKRAPVTDLLVHPIRPHVQAELDAAAARGADFAASFRKLERAHVLSQVSTREHVRVHWHMLVWAVRQRDTREFFGQILRIVGAATKTAIGLVPTGNTGGSNVGPFRRMPVSDEFAAVLADASK